MEAFGAPPNAMAPSQPPMVPAASADPFGVTAVVQLNGGNGMINNNGIGMGIVNNNNSMGMGMGVVNNNNDGMGSPMLYPGNTGMDMSAPAFGGVPQQMGGPSTPMTVSAAFSGVGATPRQVREKPARRERP